MFYKYKGRYQTFYSLTSFRLIYPFAIQVSFRFFSFSIQFMNFFLFLFYRNILVSILLQDKVSMEGSSKKMMKRPIEEVYGCDAAEGFKKGKKETVEHYRALLRLSNEYRLSENDWNLASSKANSIAVQIELLEDIIKADGKFDLTAELEKLKEEHSEAEGMLADVKVKVPDWDKLGESWLCHE